MQWSVKVMLIVLRNMKGPIINDFLEKVATVNSASFCRLLQPSSSYSQNDPTHHIWKKIKLRYIKKFSGSIWPIDGTLTGTAILIQSGPDSDGNKEVLHNTQILNRSLTIRCSFMSYLRHILRKKGVRHFCRGYS